MITVLSVVGTRPEAIKMAPVVRELERHTGRVRSLVCVTGQHREMLEPVLALFDIRPDFDLAVMEPDQSLASLTAALLTALEPIVRDVKPDWVLAQGDTTTVLVSSLVAYYQDARFGHVEAGLRTGDRRRPFPEEMNRRVADMLADAFFVPTETARKTLLTEAVPAERIVLTGNTVVDALLDVAQRPFDWSNGPLEEIPVDGRIVLVSAHRRESFGAPFRELCRAIRKLAEHYAEEPVHFVYPVHLNPNVRKPVHTILSGLDNVHLLDPLDYLTLVNLMKRATVIVTDSGGMQEEAPSFGVPVLVMRDKTERPEGIEMGIARLVGTKRDRIIEETRRLLDEPEARTAMAPARNPYGDGQAARRIVEFLLEQGEA